MPVGCNLAKNGPSIRNFGIHSLGIVASDGQVACRYGTKGLGKPLDWCLGWPQPKRGAFGLPDITAPISIATEVPPPGGVPCPCGDAEAVVGDVHPEEMRGVGDGEEGLLVRYIICTFEVVLVGKLVGVQEQVHL